MALDSSKGSQARPPPPGVYVPVPTFFSKPDSPDYDPVCPPLDLGTQTEHSLFLVKGGVKGLVILGSSGEAIFVRAGERRDLIASQRKALDDAGYSERPIIAGTASQNIDETVELIKDSQAAGAAYAMVLGPGYFAPATSQTGLQKWFEVVADRSPIPILIYHYPGVTNNLYIAPSTFENLASHPKIVGTKLSHGVIDDQTLIASSPRIDHEHFYVFTGLGQNLLPVLTIGGVGAIDGLANCFPRVVGKLFRLFNDSSAEGISEMDLDEMRELQFKICEGEKLIAAWGVVGIKEAVARLWGFGNQAGARLPLAGGFQGGEDEWAKWKKTFQGLKELEEKLKAEGKGG